MKKILLFTTFAALMVACSSSTSNTKNVTYANGNGSNSAANAKYQIIDQEFDNMLAPDADYETLKDYELQACGDSYLPPAELKTPKAVVKKAAAKAAAESVAAAEATVNSKAKKVTTTKNVYYIDAPAPTTPIPASSSTTTTTIYTNDSSSSSSSNY